MQTNLEWTEREATDPLYAFRMDPEFYQQVKDYCKENQIKMSQFTRYALARAMRQH